jgi:hypothetical protein
MSRKNAEDAADQLKRQVQRKAAPARKRGELQGRFDI